MADPPFYMKRALELARKACGRTSPNPMVGAVLVKQGRIIGEGYHERAGLPHAEVVAIRNAAGQARGADLYVTLEPCCHWGRQPPCTNAILEAGVRRVFLAIRDPNPQVSGRGASILREAGIEVHEGVLAHEAQQLNEAYFKYIQERVPFGILKAAMTLDGKVATVSGESQWITSEASRHKVHQLRDRVDAILVGIGTVLADDPALTTRIPGGRDAIRIILDSRARLPLTARICHLQSAAPTWLATTAQAPLEKLRQLEKTGVEVLLLPALDGRVDLRALAEVLGQREITTLLIEGGPTVHAAALAAGLVDKVLFFVAPKILGGASAPGPIGGAGIPRLNEAISVQQLEGEPIGDDWLFTGYVTSSDR